MSPVSNRVGARLAGAPLPRAVAGELPSEGIVLGAVQVPADGQPLIFLADHPTTGGYPVIGVVTDVTPLAQARPGTTRQIAMDLNADLGEGFGIWRLGDDEALLDLVTSANVACGFHGGDPSTMRRVCEGAAERGVAVGAQVGYRDLAGFGRRRIEYDFAELRDEMIYQIGALDAFCRLFRHPGPLPQAARRALPRGGHRRVPGGGRGRRDLRLRPGAAGALPARLGARPARRRRRACRWSPRAFADRGLPAQRHAGAARPPGAVITDPEQVAARAVRMATERTVVAVDGTVIPCAVESICVHGDTPGRGLAPPNSSAPP